MSSIVDSPPPSTAASTFRACIPPAVTAVLGGVVLALSQNISITTTTAGTELGPKWWPSIIASLIVVFSLVAIAQVIFGKPVPSEQVSSSSEGKTSLLWVCVLLMAFVIAWQLVGFFPSAAAFLVLLALVLGERSPLKLAGFTAVTIGVLYVLFVFILRIPL